MNKVRKLTSLLLALLLAFGVFSAAAYADFPTPPGGYSMTVEARHGDAPGTPVPGMRYSLYKIATIDEAGNVTPTAKAAAIGVSIPGAVLPGTISSSDAWRTALTTLGNYVDQLDKIGDELSTGADGRLVFNSGLEPAIYLIVGQNVVVGSATYSAQTAWTQIPVKTASGWDFNPVVKPKIDKTDTPVPAKTVQVVKIWDDDYMPDSRPDSVEVELLKNGTVDRTQVLTIGAWDHTWTGLDGSATWTVREAKVPRFYLMSSSISGNVTTITNTRDFVEVDPPIEKLVQGDPGAPAATSTFRFRMEAVSNTAGLPVAEMPMPEGSSNGVKVKEVTGPGSYEFGSFRIYYPGTYVYKISEDDVGEAGYTYDQNFYYKVFEVTEVNNRLTVSEYLLDSRQQALQDIDPTFVNTWKPDPTDSVSITLSAIKRLTGTTPKTTADFEINLVGKNGAPMPTGSNNSRKTIKIHGAGSGSLGTITYTSPGTYIYEISERDGKISGYTYDKSVYTVTVVISRNSQNKLVATVTAVKNGSQSVSWDNLEFVNNYKEPSPQTGILWWPVPVLLSGGLLLVLMGIIRRRKYEN